MQPYKTTIIIYADSEQQAEEFSQEFYKFVDGKRAQGIAVSASKIMQAIKMFADNKYLNNYLKM